MLDKNCIFCKIGKHTIDSNIVYEDDDVIAFLDISQVTKGHTLVIPKQHFDSFLNVPLDVLTKVTRIAQKIALLLVVEHGAKGVNILSNCGEAAGQTIMHFHIHVIPRYLSSDGFKIGFQKNEDLKNINLPALAQDLKNKL